MATFPSVDEVVKTDAFPTVTWDLEPHSEGMLPVAAGRGGPFNIHWEVHGDGPVKLIVCLFLIAPISCFCGNRYRESMAALRPGFHPPSAALV